MIGSLKFKLLFKEIFITLLAIIIIVVNVVGIYLGSIFYDKVCKIYINRKADTYTIYKSTFDNERLNLLNKDEVIIASKFGYKLSGTYIKNSMDTNNTVIIVHGILGSRWEAMKYADIYLDLGFNVLIYDSRYHGESGGTDVSLGYFEKYDLDNCVQWVKKANPGGVIGIHGESLGAATALLHSNINEDKKNVKFYVVDCPYSDLPELFKDKLSSEIKVNNKIVSNIMVFYSSVVAWYKSGFSLYSISPIKAIKNVETPIMFIHGADDDLIPPTMSMDLYRAKNGAKALYIAPNSGHAMSYLNNKKEYTEKVTQFLEKVKIIDAVKLRDRSLKLY